MPDLLGPLALGGGAISEGNLVLEMVPMFAPQLPGEPMPQNSRLKAAALDKGLGVELNRDIFLHRPDTH